MDSNEIKLMLKNVKPFIGVFARDVLPKRIKKGALIINTDSSEEPGEHWVAIIVLKDRVEYFDPFGLPPLHDDFLNFIKRNGNNLVYNHYTIQKIGSKKCGKFCIAYIKHRCRGHTYLSFVKKFLSGDSDKIVEKLVKK